jgi:predicted RNA-binding protein with PUA-like domain
MLREQTAAPCCSSPQNFLRLCWPGEDAVAAPLCRGADSSRSAATERRVYRNMTMKKFWLVKSEPEAYSWTNLVADGLTSWTGVRNYTARNNLRAMSKGDEVFFYHSVTEKAVVGIAAVKRTAYPDPTAKEGDWSTVDLVPKRKLALPVTLAKIRANRTLKNIPLLRQSRLSVQPLGKDEFAQIVQMAGG